MVRWFGGNRRMLPGGVGLLLLTALLMWWLTRPELAPTDLLKIVVILMTVAGLMLGLTFVLLPDRVRIDPYSVQIWVAGIIPGRAYGHGAFKGLALDHPPSELALEFTSGRQIPILQHHDPFVLYERAREMSRVLKTFVRNGDVKLFKDGEPPNTPNFFLQFEDLQFEILKSRYPLAEMARKDGEYRFKLFMARPLPNGYRGLIVTVSPDGLKIHGEGMAALVDLPLDEVIAVESTPYFGILTRTRGVLRLEGIGNPQDRYLVLHLAAALRDLLKGDKK